jgi:hypothetical protein
VCRGVYTCLFSSHHEICTLVPAIIYGRHGVENLGDVFILSAADKRILGIVDIGDS